MSDVIVRSIAQAITSIYPLMQFLKMITISYTWWVRCRHSSAVLWDSFAWTSEGRRGVSATRVEK